MHGEQLLQNLYKSLELDAQLSSDLWQDVPEI